MSRDDDKAPLAEELRDHDAILAAIVAHLVAHEDAVVPLPGLGHVVGRVWRPLAAPDPRTGEILPVKPKRAAAFEPRRDEGAPPPGTVLTDARLADLARAIDGALAERGVVHAPGLGTFGFTEGAPERTLTFVATRHLRVIMNGGDGAPMSSAHLEEALACLKGRSFAVRDLHDLLARRPRAAEPEDDVLVDLPAGLPKLLRAALAKSAELGNADAFHFFTPMHREWAYRDFAKGERASAPPDVFLLSGAPPRWSGKADRTWVLRLADLGQEDPILTWCDDHASLETSPHRVPVSIWVQLFALETALGPLDRAQAARVREVVSATCPEIGPFVWPARFVGMFPDPWLHQVVLTW